MRHTRGFLVAVVALFLLLALPVAAGTDFIVAGTGLVETRPAVAVNTQTGQFLVAYKVNFVDLGGLPHYRVQCQLHNADSSKSGPALSPFGDIDVLGGPAIAYNKVQNIFFVATVEHEQSNEDRVVGWFLNGDGTNRGGRAPSSTATRPCRGPRSSTAPGRTPCASSTTSCWTSSS